MHGEVYLPLANDFFFDADLHFALLAINSTDHRKAMKAMENSDQHQGYAS